MTWGLFEKNIEHDALERTIADLRLPENQDTPEHREQLHHARQALLKLTEVNHPGEIFHISANGHHADTNSYIGVSIQSGQRIN